MPNYTWMDMNPITSAAFEWTITTQSSKFETIEVMIGTARSARVPWAFDFVICVRAVKVPHSPSEKIPKMIEEFDQLFRAELHECARVRQLDIDWLRNRVLQFAGRLNMNRSTLFGDSHFFHNFRAKACNIFELQVDNSEIH